jgi:hypothetical protein
MTPEQIKHLWRLLGQTYGSKFAEQYGPTPNEAWGAMLENATPEQAKHALHKLIHAGSAFPPTLPEFVAQVKTFRPAVIHDFPRPAPSFPPISIEQARENIRRLRELVNGPALLRSPNDPI